jgi:hypothetical protein
MLFLPTLNMQAQKASDSLRHHKNGTGAALGYRLRISLASGGHGLSAETQSIVAPLPGTYKVELYEQIRREYEFGVGSGSVWHGRFRDALLRSERFGSMWSGARLRARDLNSRNVSTTKANQPECCVGVSSWRGLRMNRDGLKLMSSSRVVPTSR